MEDGQSTKLEELSYGDMLRMANEFSQKGKQMAAMVILLKMIDKWPERVFNPKNDEIKRNGGDSNGS